jgi:SAM-dependent methyltransferase
MAYSRLLKRSVNEHAGGAGYIYYATLNLGSKAIGSFLKRGRPVGQVRTRTMVEQKYDAGRAKIEIGSYDEYVLGTHVPDFTVIDGRLEFTNPRRANEAYYRYLLERIHRYAGEGTIVEFGSGGGRNIIHLARSGITNPLVGLELSGVSVDLARRAAAQFGVEARFEQCDVTGKLPELGPVDIVFSVLAFEMMPRIFIGALENIRRLRPRAAVFLEPIEELWPRSARGLLSRVRVRQLDRLRGFYDEAAKLGKVVEARDIGYATNPINPTALMVVELDS